VKFIGKQGEYFEITNVEHIHQLSGETTDSNLSMLWFEDSNSELIIDGIPYKFKVNESVFLTQFHQIQKSKLSKVSALLFNRSFYCVLDHDSEVGCKGVLFYGAAKLPIIQLQGMELEVFKTAWKMAKLEFDMKDNLQLEMLQMMLKRLLILSTRVYKSQYDVQLLSPAQNDLVREFNYQVEHNFRTIHSVQSYAKLLHKSSKTLSNTFKKLGEKSPLILIQERIMLEARRLLYYTQKDVSEIAYELGYSDIQTFSRFFKKKEGISPSTFRLRRLEEK